MRRLRGYLEQAPWRAWAWLWAVPALLLTLGSLVGADVYAALGWAAQFLLAFVVSLVVVPRRVLRLGLATVLIFFAASALTEPYLDARTWQDPSARSLGDTLSNLGQSTVSTVANRTWRFADAEPSELSFEARLAAGATGWDWFRSGGAFEVTPAQENGATFTRVSTPQGGDPYLMRTFDLRSPAGGRTFRVALELRAPIPLPAAGCRGVWLQVWGAGGGGTCKAVALDISWQTSTLEWTVPSTAKDAVLRVILNDFDGTSYDVRNVELFELEGGKAVRLEPLLQEGAGLNIAWDDQSADPRAGRGFRVGEDWQRFTFPLTPPPGATRLRAQLSVGSSQSRQTSLEVRNTAVTTETGQAATPVPSFGRRQLWFAHPNLAAHTVSSLGLAALATTTTPGVALLISVLAGLSVFLAKSRTALFALGLGVALFLGLTPPIKRFLRTNKYRGGLLLLVGAALGALVVSGVAGGVFADRPGISRLDIWQVSVQAFLENPWQGIGDTFTRFWLETYKGQSTEPISHAHNFWLHLAASHGVPGFLASLWMTGGLLLLAWRWGRVRGLALVVPVLLMNVFDTTLLYAGVLFPLVLGLNALRLDTLQRRKQPRQPTTSPGSDTSYTEVYTKAS